jgi:hypothetical protein
MKPLRTSTPVNRRPTPATAGSSTSRLREPLTADTGFQTLYNILSSCEPSLAHTLPILDQLGIRNREHLHALAKLSEETRDRQVRDVALRSGMTVVEWAILLDKLLSL